jgi:hypothetical protein
MRAKIIFHFSIRYVFIATFDSWVCNVRLRSDFRNVPLFQLFTQVLDNCHDHDLDWRILYILWSYRRCQFSPRNLIDMQ